MEKVAVISFGKKDGFEIFDQRNTEHLRSNSDDKYLLEQTLQLEFEKIKVLPNTNLLRVERADFQGQTYLFIIWYGYSLDIYRRDAFNASALVFKKAPTKVETILNSLDEIRSHAVRFIQSEGIETLDLSDYENGSQYGISAESPYFKSNFNHPEAFVFVPEVDKQIFLQLIFPGLIENGGLVSNYSAFYTSQNPEIYHQINSVDFQIISRDELKREEERIQDRKLFEIAVSKNSISGYKEYLDENLHGSFRHNAENAIKEISAYDQAIGTNSRTIVLELYNNLGENSIRKEACVEWLERNKQEDSSLWHEANRLKTLPRYQDYIDKFPSGTYRSEALYAIADLKLFRKGSEAFDKTGDLGLLNNYKQKYGSSGIKSREADDLLLKAKLAQFEKEFASAKVFPTKGKFIKLRDNYPDKKEIINRYVKEMEDWEKFEKNPKKLALLKKYLAKYPNGLKVSEALELNKVLEEKALKKEINPKEPPHENHFTEEKRPRNESETFTRPKDETDYGDNSHNENRRINLWERIFKLSSKKDSKQVVRKKPENTKSFWSGNNGIKIIVSIWFLGIVFMLYQIGTFERIKYAFQNLTNKSNTAQEDPRSDSKRHNDPAIISDEHHLDFEEVIAAKEFIDSVEQIIEGINHCIEVGFSACEPNSYKRKLLHNDKIILEIENLIERLQHYEKPEIFVWIDSLEDYLSTEKYYSNGLKKDEYSVIEYEVIPYTGAERAKKEISFVAYQNGIEFNTYNFYIFNSESLIWRGSGILGNNTQHPLKSGQKLSYYFKLKNP